MTYLNNLKTSLEELIEMAGGWIASSLFEMSLRGSATGDDARVVPQYFLQG
jgi:hypothetical protein